MIWAQLAISSRPDKRERAAALSRIIYARDLTPEGRPSLQASLRKLVDDALEAQVMQEAPSQINVVGFGKMAGKYFIDEMEHSYSPSGGYKTQVKASKVEQEEFA